MRVKITLACTECKQRNYNTKKNKKNDPDRIEMNKYCRFCKKHTWNNNIRSLTISAIDLIPSDTPIQLDLWSDFTKHNKRLILERTMEDIRRRYGLHSINFAALTTGLKMPAHREVEYKMPSVMYH